MEEIESRPLEGVELDLYLSIRQFIQDKLDFVKIEIPQLASLINYVNDNYKGKKINCIHLEASTCIIPIGLISIVDWKHIIVEDLETIKDRVKTTIDVNKLVHNILKNASFYKTTEEVEQAPSDLNIVISNSSNIAYDLINLSKKGLFKKGDILYLTDFFDLRNPENDKYFNIRTKSKMLQFIVWEQIANVLNPINKNFAVLTNELPELNLEYYDLFV